MWKVSVGVLATFVGFTFYETITDFLSDRATDVTSKSLEDPEFIRDATVFGTEIGKQIVKNLTQDPEVKEIFKVFFADLFVSDYIKMSAKELANDTVRAVICETQHELLRDEATELAKQRLIQLFEDPEMQIYASNFVWKTFGGAFVPWKWDSVPPQLPEHNKD
jgi:hypothetical protein